MKKITNLLLLIACYLLPTLAMAQGKQPYSVLYVGGTSNYGTFGGAEVDSVTIAKDAKVRAANFTSFLKSRFKKVKYVDAKEYNQDMSNDYDVTILDGRPNEIRPTIHEGEMYALPQYFTADFDRPIVCIAEASDRYLNSIGSKCDWFCMCLMYDAHHWNADHQIFKGPWKVNIKAYKEKTYPTAFEYGPMYGYTVPDSIMQFTIDGKKFQDRKGHRIGVVARPWGFTDSPETEIISSGVCGKSIDAIAIGRHANIFHWGFSAMPSEMTPAGQAMFANAVAYMAKRGPEHMIARKLYESMATRATAISKKYLVSRACYDESCKSTEQFVQMYAQQKEAALKKKAAGEKLTKMEEQMAEVNIDEVRAANSSTFPQFIQRQAGKAFHYFGFDEEMYKKYYTDNYNYFYVPNRFGYELDVDEDARNLGIANNDIRILDEAIKLIEKNESAKNEKPNPYRQSQAYTDYQTGKRLLDRYTLVRFETAKEYRDWYNTYKDKMFFTESGGWLWLINTQDKSVPGNDYTVIPEYKKVLTPTLGKYADMGDGEKVLGDGEKVSANTNHPTPNTLTRDNPVAYSAYYDAQKHEIVVTQDILNGFHTYATLDPNDPYNLTEVNITLKGGEKVGKMKTPATSPFEGSKKTTVYEGSGEFRQSVKGSGEATVTVNYQACDAEMCTMPKTATFTVKF